MLLPWWTTSFTVNQLTRTGSLDPTFGIGGKQIIDFYDFFYEYLGFNARSPSTDPAIAVTVQPDGSILVVGDVG